MADANRDLNRNDTISQDLGTDPKKRKIEEDADSINHKKLTDVNQHCLELIFIHLNLEDLLSVANANQCLKYATFMPFVRNYAGKSIGIDLHRIYYESYRENKKLKIKKKFECYQDEKEITIIDLKMTLQMLRCFGGMINELEFKYLYNVNFRVCHRIMSYIHEFCHETLRNVTFPRALEFEKIEKPFLNVEDLTISNLSDLKEKCLSKLFPKVCRLCIRDCKDETLSVLLDKFPNLRHFALHLIAGANVLQGVVNVLQLNPNIRSLTIDIRDLNYFDSIKEHLQSIENLDLILTVFAGEMPQIQNYSIYLQNVTKFKFSYYFPPEILIESIPKIPFLFSQLKEFIFEDRNITSDVFLNFVLENRMIEKLTFRSRVVLKLIRTGQIQNALPSLKNIVYLGNLFKTTEVLKKCLPYFEFLESFTLFNEENEDQIRSVCDNKWEVNRNSKYSVTLERIQAII